MTFLCISCYLKGEAFLKACKEAGNTVYLLTAEKLRDAPWPREAIEEFFFMDTDVNTPENFHNLAKGLAWLMRSRKIDRIVALDDFDVEKATFLREEFRFPGMGQTTGRRFRDKLTMRTAAAEAGIRVPPFSALFNDQEIHEFTQRVPAPWVVKPRAEASATGITKVHTAEELWRVLEETGEERYHYLIEQFKPGAVFHTDSLTMNGEVIFCRASGYLNTPFEVAHGGGIFRTAIVEHGSPEDVALHRLNEQVIQAFGMHSSASHTEFIRADEDGEYYFLETSARVGGAHIADMLEAASGINIWAEWARIENALVKGIPYQLPPVRDDYAGILISLARQEYPDMSGFNDPEVVWKINKRHHVGLIMRSPQRERIMELLENYAPRVYAEFHASAPAPDKPTH